MESKPIIHIQRRYHARDVDPLLKTSRWPRPGYGHRAHPVERLQRIEPEMHSRWIGLYPAHGGIFVLLGLGKAATRA